MEGEAATRMTLMSKKGQIKLASDGVTLLEGKREALLQELIDRARELRSLRSELHLRGRRAVADLDAGAEEAVLVDRLLGIVDDEGEQPDARDHPPDDDPLAA